jgi:L-ascorbate metabolism protein UlaG (beta-lactamase superfamily)
MKKFFKYMLISIVTIVVLFVLGVVLFLKFAPQIGQVPEGADLERIKKSPNHNGEIFINKVETHEANFSEAMKTLPDFIWNKNGSPEKPISTDFDNSINSKDSSCYITWFGHSAFLLEIDEKRILIDPMLGNSASPIYVTTKRFPYTEPIDLSAIKDIDAVIISHDHYDHLDYPTIEKIKDEVGHFYTMLGVGSHLKRWGVPEEKITELDWWQSTNLADINLIATPSRHFSGRGFSDRNTTQWGSWIIKNENLNIYFSGDGGYGPHFKEIGEKYGPFDFAMLECGQYNEAWHDIHMIPEESVQAGIDVKAKLLMPIHWGAFQLSVHSWTDPITRFKAKAKELNAEVIHPEISKRFKLGEEFPKNEWWNESM